MLGLLKLRSSKIRLSTEEVWLGGSGVVGRWWKVIAGMVAETRLM